MGYRKFIFTDIRWMFKNLIKQVNCLIGITNSGTLVIIKFADF